MLSKLLLDLKGMGCKDVRRTRLDTKMNLKSHNRQGIPSEAEWLSASQERLCSMELVGYFDRLLVGLYA